VLLTFTATLTCSVICLNVYPRLPVECISAITDSEIRKVQYSQVANLDQCAFVIFMYQKG